MALPLRQTGPTSDDKIYGAPGAAPPLRNINVRYANGNTETIVRSAVDGSFAMIRGRAAGGVTITSGHEIVATTGFNPASPDWGAGPE